MQAFISIVPYIGHVLFAASAVFFSWKLADAVRRIRSGAYVDRPGKAGDILIACLSVLGLVLSAVVILANALGFV